MLYEKERHTKIKNIAWSEEIAWEKINNIFEETISSFKRKKFWKTHPDEDNKREFLKTLYYGASGTLWGLIQISEVLNRELPFDCKKIIIDITDAYLDEPDTNEVIPSYFVGIVGILAIRYKITPDEKTRNLISDYISKNTTNPANEAYIGNAGTILASLFLYDWERDDHWKELFLENANYLFNEWQQDKDGKWIWVQDLYGKKRKLIGAAHGFFGNVFPLLKGMDLLSEKQRKLLIERTIYTTLDSVEEDINYANWPDKFTSEDRKMRVQWCHGAPSAIVSLSPFPIGYSDEIESILLKAGELIWESGPLLKGVGICHGTDGNGYSFLKLHDRSGDKKWLERARSFAMHSIYQSNGRHTLWTGDIGLALYLISCIKKNANFPTLDYL
ncbi:LanC-like protein [Bacteriovoracaceae bacterium]|nr:LanC-like protein [Bacteriovoracaceae bacterium]